MLPLGDSVLRQSAGSQNCPGQRSLEKCNQTNWGCFARHWPLLWLPQWWRTKLSLSKSSETSLNWVWKYPCQRWRNHSILYNWTDIEQPKPGPPINGIKVFLKLNKRNSCWLMELQTFLKLRRPYLFKVSFNKELKIKRIKLIRSKPVTLIEFVPPCLKTVTSSHSVISGLPTHFCPEQSPAMALLSWRGPFPPQTVPENCPLSSSRMFFIRECFF